MITPDDARPALLVVCAPDLLTAARAGLLNDAVAVPESRQAAATRKSAELAAIERDEFVEDVTFMAANGETTEGAAERLGITPNGLHRRLTHADRKVNRPDLWEALRTNEVHRFGTSLGDLLRENTNQYGSAGTSRYRPMWRGLEAAS